MSSDGERWRNPAAYAYAERLDRADFAWELLRRDPAFRAERLGGGADDPGSREVSRWGLHFRPHPDRRADEGLVVWRPELLVDAVRLTHAAPHAAGIAFDPAGWGGTVAVLQAADGWHVELRQGRLVHRLWWPYPELPAAGLHLAAVIALDEHAAERAEAALRFRRAVGGRPLTRPPDWKGAPAFLRPARRSFVLMALDGWLAGASYRAIAAVLFGPSRIADDVQASARAWQSSPWRARTLRLVAIGQRLMRGGYRELLRPRRRKPSA